MKKKGNGTGNQWRARMLKTAVNAINVQKIINKRNSENLTQTVFRSSSSYH